MLDAPAALDQSQLDELNLVVDIKRISKFFRFYIGYCIKGR